MDVLAANKCEMCGDLTLNEDIVTHMGHWLCRAKCGRDVPASDHSSSYDGGGDSLSDSSSIEFDNICPLCEGLYTDGLAQCDVCGGGLCDTCVLPCVTCDAGVCLGCIKGDMCRTCESIFDSRSFYQFKKTSYFSTTVRTPLEFQWFLDQLSEHKGAIIDLDDRDEDGLELHPPLLPLPKVAPPGQRVIDDYVKRVLLLSPP